MEKEKQKRKDMTKDDKESIEKTTNSGDSKKEKPVDPIKEAPSPDVTEEEKYKEFQEQRKKDREQLEQKEKEAELLKKAVEELIQKEQTNDDYSYDNTPSEEQQKINLAVKKALEEKERQDLPKTLERSYPDFKDVCSRENIEYLEYKDPELSQALQELS